MIICLEGSVLQTDTILRNTSIPANTVSCFPFSTGNKNRRIFISRLLEVVQKHEGNLLVNCLPTLFQAFTGVQGDLTAQYLT
jgi:hypothetical protein